MLNSKPGVSPGFDKFLKYLVMELESDSLVTPFSSYLACSGNPNFLERQSLRNVGKEKGWRVWESSSFPSHYHSGYLRHKCLVV